MSGDGLMDKKELAEYLKLKVPTINKMLARDKIPGVVRLSGKIVRFNRARIEEWVEALTSDNAATEPVQDIRKHYRRQILNIPGKRGNFGWKGIIEKMEVQAQKKKINMGKGIYPLFLFHAILGIAEVSFIEFLTKLAKEKVVELVPGRSTDIKKGTKVYKILGKPCYSFIYHGIDRDS